MARCTAHRSGSGSASTSCQDASEKRTTRSLTDSPRFRELAAGERQRVTARAFDPVSGLLAIGGSPSIADLTGPARVSLWNVAARTLATNLDTDGTFVIAETFAPGGRILAAADNDGDTYLWNIGARKIITTFPSHLHGSALAVAFSPDGKTLAVAHSNGTVELWSVATGTQIDILQIPAGVYPQVTSVAFSPDGKTLAAGTLDENEAGSTFLWSTATYRIIATLKAPGGAGTTALAFSPGGATLAVGVHDATTYLWNMATRKVAATLDDPGGIFIAALAFTPNDRALAALDVGGTAYVWSTATKGVTATLACPGGSGNWVAVSADGAVLASGTSGATCLWKLNYRATLSARLLVSP
jgi:WD40 repeat protein